MSKIYKYLGAENIEKVFCSEKFLSLKCSYPRNFNDPYELFFAMDFDKDPALLAFYKDVVGEVPQLPTTCFSKSPAVIPMWAHYAKNHEGFVIEFDESRLVNEIADARFGDISYKSSSDCASSGDGYSAFLGHALETGKPRYARMLLQSAFYFAYFTKMGCWGYEQERRMIVDESSIRNDDGLMLLDVPFGCVSSIIAGLRSSEQTKGRLREVAKSIGCKFFELRMGRVVDYPFFEMNKGSYCVFDGGEFKLLNHTERCCKCGEPRVYAGNKCSWCAIRKKDEVEARNKNPLRIYAAAGMLEECLSRN